ncbi:MAG TPA: hypothetical protein VFT49_01100 [Candidatus Saccharimonadales bacterium]|nr:hypothetical protein [Candidatus Saccharimonadales bacterium]
MAKANLRRFDWEKVAHLDAQMWRSYYNHRFFKMFLQLIQLMRTQLRTNWVATLKLAYYAAAAATDYRLKKGRENYQKTLKNLTKFYKAISDNCTEPFDYKKAAELELEWWDIHRYPEKYKKTLEASLAESAAAIYNVPASGLKTYAKYRAAAMMLPNHEGDWQENPPDWNEVERLLIISWRSGYKVIQAK